MTKLTEHIRNGIGQLSKMIYRVHVVEKFLVIIWSNKAKAYLERVPHRASKNQKGRTEVNWFAWLLEAVHTIIKLNIATNFYIYKGNFLNRMQSKKCFQKNTWEYITRFHTYTYQNVINLS